MAKHDVVVVGGGHNGLIMTCYLAKAGLDVCLVELHEKCGGGVMTEEMGLKGFRHDPFSSFHQMMPANPMINRDELGLQAKYGLKYISYSPGYAFLYPDDRALMIYDDIGKTCESISQFSKKDAEAYPRFMAWCGEMQRIFADYMFNPPPNFGNMVSFLEASEQGCEYLKLMFGSALDAAEEWFESPELVAAVIRGAAESLASPGQKGTGSYVFVFAGDGNAIFPQGGSGSLSEALTACARDLGATIRVSSPVETIKVQGGEAKGVVLESGEEILASKAVVSALGVKHLFLKLVKSQDLPVNFQDKVGRLRQGKFVSTKQNFSLNEALNWRAGGDVNKAACVRIMPKPDEVLDLFHRLEQGLSQTHDIGVIVPTLVDPTRAPAGKHLGFMWLDEPYDLKDGGPAKWNQIKSEIMDGAMETLKARTTNVTDENILERFSRTPLELEQYNPTWVRGDANHLILTTEAVFANRPMPGWGHYKTPIKNLYMCGASTHPGPGVLGSARAAVPQILEYLGLRFNKVVK